MKAIATTIVFFVVLLLNVSAQNIIAHTYPLTDGPDKNPMKGWNSGWWDNTPLSSVGFQYLKWNEFEPTDSSFDFTAVENVINRPGSAGRHIILRLFADWHGDTVVSDGGPAWLYSTYGVARLQAPNGRYITDYNNPNYISQAIEAIEALAAHYENDPRIYSIQLGVLGYWGEWHTFGFNDNNFDIALATKTQILDAYKNSFSNKRLMGRYPWREPLASDSTIGYHNDFFKPNNNHSLEFDTTVAANGKWLNGPIGGEIPPIDSSLFQQFLTDLFETNQGMQMIETGHYSTMQAGTNKRPCLTDPNGLRCSGFMAMQRKMGYNFQITSALFAENLSVADSLYTELNFKNIGVAPIYYDWDVQIALLDQNNLPVEILDIPYDLQSILSDSAIYTISAAMPLNTVLPADYQLAVRMIQPEADEQKANSWGLEARNTYILFANDLPTVAGTWDSTHALTGGWSILDTVTIDTAITVANSQPFIDNTVSVYPNPASNKIGIVCNRSVGIETIQVHDVTGRLVQSVDFESRAHTAALDIGSLPQGVYSLIVNPGIAQLETRFIKAR